MSASPHRNDDLAKLRWDLAAMAVEVGLIRVERVLSRRFSVDQPREPAGQPGGGRWASGSSGGDSGSRATEAVVTDDGSRVLSLRIRSHRSQTWDEQHTVTAPDGTRTVFEMEGWTQTIRDGKTGDILSRSTLTASGVESEAFLQNVRSPMRGPSRGAAAFEAALSLLGVLSQRIGAGPAIFVAPASEYKRGEKPTSEAIWVGEVDQSDLKVACPRYGEVQSMLDTTTASVESSGLYLTPQDIGKRVHYLMAKDVNSLNDPNFVAEISYARSTGLSAYNGEKDSVRLDILENTKNSTVCIYDPKTGKTGIKSRTAIDYATAALRNFPNAKRFILIEMRPNR